MDTFLSLTTYKQRSGSLTCCKNSRWSTN